jgi:hypothetical protein
MDWLQFTASVIGSLAWPLAAVVLGFMFREQVRKLLDKMKSLKGPGGIEASFSEKVQEVAIESEKVEVIGPPHAKPVPGQPPALKQNLRRSVLQWDRLRSTHVRSMSPSYWTGVRPSAAVLEAWNYLELRINDVIRICGLAPTERARDAIQILANAPFNLIDKESAGVLFGLLSLRDQVAHVRFEPDVEAATKYVESAERMTKLLEKVLDQQLEFHQIGEGTESP